MKPNLISNGIENKFKERDICLNIVIDEKIIPQKMGINIFVQIEPNEISGVFPWLIENYSKFDIVFAWNIDILEKCLNSKLFIFGTSWIDNYNDFNIENKKNIISFLTSSKDIIIGHKIRLASFEIFKNFKLNDFNKICLKSPPYIAKKDIIFKDSMYSIIIENSNSDNWITEKLIDCFLTKTIPIYWGCKNINDFFNGDGIIKFKNFTELEYILGNLSPSFFEKNINAINDNFDKSKEYINLWERLDKEIDIFLENKNE